MRGHKLEMKLLKLAKSRSPVLIINVTSNSSKHMKSSKDSVVRPRLKNCSVRQFESIATLLKYSTLWRHYMMTFIHNAVSLMLGL